MGLELRDYQKECVDIINSRGSEGRHLVVMATALGKCFARGTKILMHDGSVKCIEDIKKGEQVMGADGGPRTVTGLARGREAMYKITPCKGDPYTVNESHILSLKLTGMGRQGKRRVADSLGRKFHEGEICNISVRDYLKCSKTFKHCAKGWRTGVEYPERSLPLPPYILGLWLGDGSSQSAQITTMEPEVVRAMHTYAWENNMKVCVCDSGISGRAITYSFVGNGRQHGCNAFRNALKKLNLIWNKHIPDEYLINSRENRMKLLAGLLDTDGYLVGGVTFEISTKHEHMKDQILTLTRSLGLAAYCTPKTVKGKIYYRIDISGNTSEIPTRVGRRQAQPRKQKKDVLACGIKVEPIGEGEYYGFELIGRDRLFLLADFTVVHNTAVFSQIERKGRTLILSHRDELVRQPEKYYGGCSFGIEKADEHADGEDVVSASVQSLSKDSRLLRYPPDAFHTIIIDEAHHAAAPSYRKIVSYFSGAKQILGFTATPRRRDGVRLTDTFDDIIFSRDLRWGIENGWLSSIRCERVAASFSLVGVKMTAGDFNAGDLDDAMDPGTIATAAKAYAEECHKAGRHALIYCTSVRACAALLGTIRNLLPDGEKDSVAMLTGATDPDERKQMLEGFREGKIRCIVNCMVLTEGTDLPICDAVINMRPTCSSALYQQMIGRGTRLHEGKDYCLVIDIVPSDERKIRNLCTAPTLFGVEPSMLPGKFRERFDKENDLLELCDEIVGVIGDATRAAERMEVSVALAEAFVQGQTDVLIGPYEGRDGLKAAARRLSEHASQELSGCGLDFGSLYVTVRPEESRRFVIMPSWEEKVYISAPDVLGNVTADFNVIEQDGNRRKEARYVQDMKFEDAVSLIQKYCMLEPEQYWYSWNRQMREAWDRMPSTDSQRRKAGSCYSRFGISCSDADKLTKLEASCLIDAKLAIDERAGYVKEFKASGRQRKSTREKKEAEFLEMEAARLESMQAGREGFQEFRERIEKAYAEKEKELARERTAQDAQADAPNGRKIRGIEVNLEIKKYAGMATPRQLDFIQSLLNRPSPRGCLFTLPSSPFRLTRTEASLMIDMLLQVSEKQKHIPGEFPPVDTDRLVQAVRDAAIRPQGSRARLFIRPAGNGERQEAELKDETPKGAAPAARKHGRKKKKKQERGRA